MWVDSVNFSKQTKCNIMKFEGEVYKLHYKGYSIKKYR